MKQNNEIIENKVVSRIYAVDLLKIISMMMVLALHTNRYGGFLDVKAPSWYSFIITYYEHLAIVAVNVFIIISSWFMRNKTASTTKVVTLISVIIFWTVGSLILANFLGQNVSIKDIAKSIPFFGRAYDFMSGYLVLYMVSPFLNTILNNSTKRQRVLLAVGCILIFSLLVPITTSHYLEIGGGYSCFWFICLYFITSLLKELQTDRNTLLYILSFFLLSLIGTIGEHYHIPFISGLQYNNFIVVLSAFSLFLGFKNIKIKSTSIITIISFLSPLTLGVFLIHDHNLMESFYTTLNIASVLDGVEYTYIFIFPLSMVIIYCMISLFEYARVLLFKITHITDLINRLSISIDRMIDSITEII